MKIEAGVASEALVFRYPSLQERLTDPGFRGFMDEVIDGDVAFLQSIGERPADPALTPPLYRDKLSAFLDTMSSHHAEVIEAPGVTVIGIPTSQPERSFMAEAVKIVQERRRKVEEVLGSPLPAQVVYMGSGEIMERSYRVLGEPDMEQLPYALASGRSCYVNMDVFGKYLGKARTTEALYHEAGHVILNMISRQFALRGTSMALQEAFAGSLDERVRTIHDFMTNSYLYHSNGYRTSIDIRTRAGTMRKPIAALGFYGWLRGSLENKSSFFENVSAHDFYRFCQCYWGRDEVNVLKDLLRIQDPTDLNTRYQVPIDPIILEQMMLPDFDDLLRKPYTAISSPSPVGTITWPRNADQPVALRSQVGYLAGMRHVSYSWLNRERTCSALAVEAPGRGAWNALPPQCVQSLVESGHLQFNSQWDVNRWMQVAAQDDYLVPDPFRRDGFIRLISLHPDSTHT